VECGIGTVKAPNFPTHVNFPLFLGRLVAPSGGFSQKYINKTNSADSNDFLKFHSFYIPVGKVLMLANEKKWKVSTRWKVGGFYSTYWYSDPSMVHAPQS
jgi:hypothetical protein